MSKAANAVPAGYHTITPQLTVDDAAKTIDWYKEAFGAKEGGRSLGPDGKIMHCELTIGDSHEYGAGVKWYFLPTERLWFNAEVFKVKGAPYSGAFTPYSTGMTGWVPMLQTVLAF